jgi:hypothetical protein
MDEKGSEEVRTTVSSMIRFRPTVEDNLKAVTCEAQHPALTHPLTASLNIFVQRKNLLLSTVFNAKAKSFLSEAYVPFFFTYSNGR